MNKFDIIGAPFNRVGFVNTKNNSVEPIRVSDPGCWNGLTQWINIRNNKWGADIVDRGDIEVNPEIESLLDSQNNLLALKKYSQDIVKRVLESFKTGRKPLIIGGDHSIAIGTISGVLNFYKRTRGERVAIIWIDAHGDCNDSDESNLHGKPLAILMNKYSRWSIDKDLELSPRDIFYIGVRDLMPNEKRIIEENSITTYSIDRVDELGINQVISSIKKEIEDRYDRVYISFDYDSLDGSIFRSCATPNIGGLTSREVLNIINIFSQMGKFVGMDICEYLPELDNDLVSKELIVKILDTVWGFRV